MKKLKVSILALSVLVGGAVFASAASTLLVGGTSDIYMTNTPAPLIWSEVYSLPTSVTLISTQGVTMQPMVVWTDSNGKISGVANIIKRYYDGSNNVVAISSWYTTVKGKINASKMGLPSVQMTMKGDGYSAPSTNPVIILPNQPGNPFPGSFNLKFSAKNTAAISNNFAWHILGNLKGKITPAVQGAKQQKVDEAADLVVDRNAAEVLEMRVIVSGNKFGAILWDTDASGMGNINKKNEYNVTLKSPGGGSSKLQLKGQIIGIIDPSNTNALISTINTADIKGKVQGQKVESTGYRFAGFN